MTQEKFGSRLRLTNDDISANSEVEKAGISVTFVSETVSWAVLLSADVGPVSSVGGVVWASWSERVSPADSSGMNAVKK